MDASNKLRNIIQFMIARGCVKYEQFREFLVTLFGDQVSSQLTDGKIFEIVQQTNKRLSKFNMMIRSSMDEFTTDKFYVLISTVDNDVTRAAMHYSLKQFEFFKFLLTAIVNDNQGTITIDTVKEMAEKAGVGCGKTRNGQSEMESLLDEWVEKYWLLVVEEEAESCYTLGVRSTAELDVFIKESFTESPNDLDCKSCNNMAIYSVSCPSCNSRFHKRCSKMSINRETGHCRNCRAEATQVLNSSQPLRPQMARRCNGILIPGRPLVDSDSETAPVTKREPEPELQPSTSKATPSKRRRSARRA